MIGKVLKAVPHTATMDDRAKEITIAYIEQTVIFSNMPPLNISLSIYMITSVPCVRACRACVRAVHPLPNVRGRSAAVDLARHYGN